MERLGSDLDDGTLPLDAGQDSAQQAREESAKRCVQYLEHAVQCRNVDCSQQSCEKMKRIISHMRLCRKKANGGCPICKQFIALCCIHAKNCNETDCSVLFCLKIREKMQLQQLEQRLQDALFIEQGTETEGASGGPPQHQVGSSGNGADSMDLYEEHHHDQIGVGMEPTAQASSANVIEGAMQQPGQSQQQNMQLVNPQNQLQLQHSRNQQGLSQPSPVQHYGGARPRRQLPNNEGFSQQQHGFGVVGNQLVNDNNQGQFGGQQ